MKSISSSLSWWKISLSSCFTFTKVQWNIQALIWGWNITLHTKSHFYNNISFDFESHSGLLCKSISDQIQHSQCIKTSTSIHQGQDRETDLQRETSWRIQRFKPPSSLSIKLQQVRVVLPVAEDTEEEEEIDSWSGCGSRDQLGVMLPSPGCRQNCSRLNPGLQEKCESAKTQHKPLRTRFRD